MNRTALGIAVACIGLAIGGCNNNPNNGGGEAPSNPSTAAAPAAPANPPPAQFTNVLSEAVPMACPLS